MATRRKQSSMAQTVDNALRIVHVLSIARTEIGITDLARNLRISTSTVQRLVNTLCKHDYLRQKPGTLRYTLGYKFLEISGRILREMDLRSVARPFLEELRDRTRESVHLMILDKTMGMYVDALESPRRNRVVSVVGMREDMHSSAVGKALLAFLSREKVDGIVKEQGLERKTSRTITDRSELNRHLAKIRKRGYAIDEEEGEEGTWCVGTPIFDRSGEAIASISVSVPSHRIDKEKTQQFALLVVETASKISRTLGGPCEHGE